MKNSAPDANSAPAHGAHEARESARPSALLLLTLFMMSTAQTACVAVGYGDEADWYLWPGTCC